MWAKNKSESNVLVFTVSFFFFSPEMVEPGQDLLLAALSESGISPNDLFDIDSPDVVLANPAPTPAVQQVKTRTQGFVRAWVCCDEGVKRDGVHGKWLKHVEFS